MGYHDYGELCGESFNGEELATCAVCHRSFCYRCGNFEARRCTRCGDGSEHPVKQPHS